MPIEVAQSITDTSMPGSETAPVYAIYYSSVDDTGKMWCPDCRDVEERVERTFRDKDSPYLKVFYVGSKAEWKDPENALRKQKIVGNLPTLIRWQGGVETGRITETQILNDDEWKRFVPTQSAVA